MDEKTPERIYGWLDSQLSISGFYGGCKFNGASYSIAYGEEGKPLVRDDVLQRERKDAGAKGAKAKVAARAEKEAWKSAAISLLPPNARNQADRPEGTASPELSC